MNNDLVASVCARSPQKEATLDIDATLVEVYKKDALLCYKHFPAYQRLNVWWAEQELVMHSEFRDGNVPAGFELHRMLGEALEMLPEGVEKVYVRSDTAGYEQDLLQFMAEGKHPRFGIIEFAVGADVTPPVMKEDLAGGRLPSMHFGVNAAWWAIMILALNLNVAMKRLVLGTIDESWITRRMKAIRFLFIALPGRVFDHARELWIRIGGERAWNLLNRARDKIAALAAT